jgi:hypothetical protein
MLPLRAHNLAGGIPIPEALRGCARGDVLASTSKQRTDLASVWVTINLALKCIPSRFFPSANGAPSVAVCCDTMCPPLPRTAKELYIVLIGEGLNDFYDDIIQQEFPSQITAAIERLGGRTS